MIIFLNNHNPRSLLPPNESIPHTKTCTHANTIAEGGNNPNTHRVTNVYIVVYTSNGILHEEE